MTNGYRKAGTGTVSMAQRQRFETVRAMIIERFEHELGLPRPDAQRVADKMVKIAQKVERDANNLKLP